MEQWMYHTPKFECDEINYDLLRYSPWSGHRNFAYDFVSSFQPQCIVELGSYYGCSYFAFLQAIKDKHLNSSIYGVDTWSGDDFTKQDYEKNVYAVFCDTIKKYYGDCSNANMLRMTFDEATIQFQNESIDLLHIDGSHHYENAKHDFETWKSKVKKDGVVFFHDISSDNVYGKALGSHQFWEELKKQYPNTVQFDHSFGLGILFFSQEKYDAFCSTVNLQAYQRQSNALTIEYKDELRKNHFALQDDKQHIASLYDQLAEKDKHLDDYKRTVAGKDHYIEELKANTAAKDKVLDDYKGTVAGKDHYIEELKANMAAKDKVLDDYKGTVAGKDHYIEELKANMAAKDKVLDDYKGTVAGKDYYIEELELNMAAKDKILDNYKADVEAKQRYIDELEGKLAASNADIQFMKGEAAKQESALDEIQMKLKEKEKDLSSTLCYRLKKKLNGDHKK